MLQHVSIRFDNQWTSSTLEYLSGHVNIEDVMERERKVKVDCLNFILNLTIPYQDDRINGWNQIFSMMKDYDKKYYLWGDVNGFEEVL